MLKSFVKTTHGAFVVGLTVLLLMLSLSFALRQQEFNQVMGARNLEATYHVLLTIKALKESPAKNHRYLPTVTLGRERDKGIPWGETVPTETGEYIYTSFTPPGFLVPYVAFNIFDAQPSVNNLAKFNFVLGATVSCLLFALLWRVLVFIGHSPGLSVGGALIGSAITIFSREALQSHGVIYWSQSLYQLLFVVGLWVVFKYLSVDDDQADKRKIYASAIITTAFLGALTEWSGYIFNFGLVLLFWFGVQGVGKSKILSIGVFLVTAAAGFLTLVHYSLAVGFSPAVDAFLGRFLVRNVSSGDLSDLVEGYGLSFGLFFILFVVLTTYFIISVRQQMTGDKCSFSFSLRQIYNCLKIEVSQYSKILQAAGSRHKVLFFLFVAASIPLLENILLLQHAEEFSFDRLKFIFPAALTISATFCWLPINLRYFLGAAVLLASTQGFLNYKTDMQAYEKWLDIDAENKDLSMRVSASVDTSCAVFLSNIKVRGYANILFNRGIYENKSFDDSVELMELRRSCAAVYLEGNHAFLDLPKYTKAIVTYPDETILELRD